MGVSGILLSAGESKRMGQSKAFLKFGHKTNIENLIDEYLSSKLDEVIVVAGFNGNYLKEFIEKSIKNRRLKVLINESFSIGMFSSVQKGVKEISNDGVLIGIVDNPFTSSSIVDKLIENFKGEIIVPYFHGKGGHPVIVPFSLKEEILNANPENTTLKDIILNHKDIIRHIEFEDEKITFDMDTYEDYLRLLVLWRK